MAEEWDYETNGDLKPDFFIAGSHLEVSWKCKPEGHVWYPIVEKLALALEVDPVDLLEIGSNNSRGTVSLNHLLLSNNFSVEGVDDFSPNAHYWI